VITLQPQQLKQLNLEREQLFLQLLQHNGEVTVANFALAAQIAVE
jgi:hypothetical protein